MKRIDNITDAANQVFNIALEDKSQLVIELWYRPGIQRWTYSVFHTLLMLTGLNLCNNLNLLRPWRNVIPFGLACSTNDAGDVVRIDDFSSGRSSLYILSESEIEKAEAFIAVAAV